MKCDFDALHLSQKIYAVLGAISGITIYMYDANLLNIAIGIVLLTAILVFFCKYNRFRTTFNMGLILLIISVLTWFLYVNYADKIIENESPAKISKGFDINNSRPATLADLTSEEREKYKGYIVKE